MSAVSYSSAVENMQPNPPGAKAPAASSDIRSAWESRLRIKSMVEQYGPNGKRQVTAAATLLGEARQARLRLQRTGGAGGLSPPILQRQRQFFRGLDPIAA